MKHKVTIMFDDPSEEVPAMWHDAVNWCIGNMKQKNWTHNGVEEPAYCDICYRQQGIKHPLEHGGYVVCGWVFYFKHQNDAVRFKLAFGGKSE